MYLSRAFFAILVLVGLSPTLFVSAAQSINPAGITASKASGSFDITISEICWMGTKKNSADEWIELYNNTNSSIDLEGWVLKSTDGTPNIKLSGIIFSKSFYLLERSDDDTLPDIAADQYYQGALNNQGEFLQLFNKETNIIDEINCSENWSAGENKTKQTMERCESNWQTSQDPGGTPKAENSACLLAANTEKSANMVSPPSSLPNKTQIIIYPTGIVINEILPSPEGSDSENEWIELYNQNDHEIDISKWKLIDTRGSVKSYVFPEKTKIMSKGFLILTRPTTKITLNNKSDGLKFIQPNGKVIDEIIFGKAPLGQSYNRTAVGWQWSNIPTPGSLNIIPEPEKTIKVESLQNSNIKHLQFAERQKNQLTATVGRQIPNLLPPCSIAFVLAIFSGLTIFFLRKNLKIN